LERKLKRKSAYKSHTMQISCRLYRDREKVEFEQLQKKSSGLN